MVVVRPILFAGVLVLATAAPALAGPLYSVSLTNATPFQNTSPVALSSSLDQSEGRHGEGVAISGSVLAASILASKGADGFNNGIFSHYDADLSAHYDDIVIKGPAGGPVPVTVHIAFDAIFTQSYDRMDLGVFVDKSSVNQHADLIAMLTSPNLSTSKAEFTLALDDQNEVKSVGLSTASTLPTPAAILPGASPGPESQESLGLSTIFHNIRLDPDGFLYMTRVQSPTTAPPGLFGPGVGFHFDDFVVLPGEMTLPGIAQVGVPLTLDLNMTLNSAALGGFQLDSSGRINALHTFGVPQDGSLVFDLPDGYTAESESLNIVDNRVPGEATGAVPEPGSIILAGTGLLGFVALRKRLSQR